MRLAFGCAVVGTFNPSTKDAVQQFQEARGIRATGELDSQTVAALGIGR